MVRPVALGLPLSLAALACTPVADLDDPGPTEDDDDDGPAASEPSRVGPDAARRVDAQPREAAELAPDGPVEQAQPRIPRDARHAAPGELPGGPRRDAVIDLALAHRLMTAWIALVAVEETREKLPDGTLPIVQVHVDMPMGVTMAAEGTVGLVGRGTRVPTVGQSNPQVMGALDRDIIRRIVRAHIAEVRRCYARGLARDPDLEGRVVIAFTIDRAGGVRSATVAETDLADAAVGTCVARAVQKWRFPGGGGDVTIRYPFLLAPG